LPVSKNPLSDIETKERWAYWKATVNKGFALTKDLLQPIGMLFEYEPTAGNED
jgi:hypothetical protein